ncbi:nitroreductase family protein [Microbacterium testaceum]|uniref:Nitroreductase domain-containing protein n=1 Tax=Microbacterium testaceum TaxID=2033 RepID=A0A2T7VQ13_MICTE|nr:nitroreductase family protein [Microbacterium testaceum]PVE58741.1 hypothetical protein DC432_15915 [Microbacterium testaceum]
MSETTIVGRIASLLPQRLQDAMYVARMRMRIRSEFAADRRRYARYAAPNDWVVLSAMDPRQIEGQATKDYHRVEKGLTLPNPARPFGRAVHSRLNQVLPALASQPLVSSHVSTAVAALSQWNAGGEVAEDIAPLRRESAALGADVLQEFFESRRSVRDFDGARDVPEDILLKAAELAGHSPSVCNRQGWSLIFATGEATRRMLGHQNGNRGFGETVPVVALISMDTRLFAGSEERNQAWIDGGLFAMTLVWALHGLGLDSCMLNLSLTNEQADQLRSHAELGEYDLPIAMVAIGYGAEGHRVARSPRRPVEQIVEFRH